MSTLIRSFIYSAVIVLSVAGCSKPAESPESTDTPAASADPAAAAQPAAPLTTFASADAGATALVDALRAPDEKTLAGLFGVDYEEFVRPADVDRSDVERFLAAYDEKHVLNTDTAGKAVLAVGADNWEFPIPLVESGGKWAFDLDAGREAINTMRIGRNELAVIQTALAYYDAQKEYASKDRNGDGMLEYAQKVVSTEGQKDGLYWPGEEDVSPLGPLLAEGVVPGEPYHGYRYRILTAQGSHASGGARSYILGKRMSGGFGLVAWPAAYGETGVMTFIVNHDGVVYEKDLGDDTENAVAGITTFDPDDTWKEAKPEA